MKEWIKRDDGSVMVLVAFIMVGLLALMALVIDGGSLYLEKNRLQKIADAAALAGAQDLPSFPVRANDAIVTTANKNGTFSNVTIEFHNANHSLQVFAEKEVNLVFGNVLGFKDPTITAIAKVDLLSLSSVTGAIPLGVEYSADIVHGELVELKVGEATIGNFGALILTGPGAKDFETDLTHGYEFTLEVGDVLETKTGKMTQATKRAVDYRVSHCPEATFTNYQSDCARVLMVPVYKPVNTGIDKLTKVEVVGFASFFLEGTSPNDDSVVIGRFIESTQKGDINRNLKSYGAFGYKLTQ
ncbi:pilus assembly protein TadG-related protein [Salirhabdus sp. Marseille-P4669]|uniref:pilus assembly protein TadG-related protein n=1 Tax=Salirhabdus sp. Marseille-P4669 TaxID=2042310 RepID=UPI000C7AB19F|nr:pilus assembly protein TadG-related protein [Salirhabdus sp. Marseille-P4669]